MVKKLVVSGNRFFFAKAKAVNGKKRITFVPLYSKITSEYGDGTYTRTVIVPTEEEIPEEGDPCARRKPAPAYLQPKRPHRDGHYRYDKSDYIVEKYDPDKTYARECYY